MLVAAAPSLVRAPFEPGSFVVGKAAGIVGDGRPTVVILFASWCVGCIQELPTVIRDYSRFKDRVNFIGVDYLDSANAGSAFLAKYAIPFQVFSSHENADAPPPVEPNATPSALSLHVGGLPLSRLYAIIPSLANQLPASSLAKLTDVANACKTLSDASCRAYASAHGVDLGTTPSASPTTTHTADNVTDYLTLPHLFVIDAHGIVRADQDGYTERDDPIARALGNLGIR
jgi:thiol-disulfide isomerase/thioredoxin